MSTAKSLRFDVIFPGWISIIFGQCLHHRHQDCKTPHHSPLSLCPSVLLLSLLTPDGGAIQSLKSTHHSRYSTVFCYSDIIGPNVFSFSFILHSKCVDSVLKVM